MNKLVKIKDYIKMIVRDIKNKDEQFYYNNA